MPQDEWDQEGQIFRTDENGKRMYLVGAVGPEIEEKKNRYWQLEEQKQHLEEQLSGIRKEQHEIDQWMAVNAGGWERD